MCNEQLYKQYFYVFQSPAFQAMTDGAKNVYGIMMSWADEKGLATPAVIKIAETAKVSERQAYNLIRELRETGIITVGKDGRFNVYDMKPALDFRRGRYCENGIPETPLHVSTHETPLHVSADSFPLTPATPATPEAPLHTKALTKHLQNKELKTEEERAGRVVSFPNQFEIQEKKELANWKKKMDAMIKIAGMYASDPLYDHEVFMNSIQAEIEEKDLMPIYNWFNYLQTAVENRLKDARRSVAEEPIEERAAAGPAWKRKGGKQSEPIQEDGITLEEFAARKPDLDDYHYRQLKNIRGSRRHPADHWEKYLEPIVKKYPDGDPYSWSGKKRA